MATRESAACQVDIDSVNILETIAMTPTKRAPSRVVLRAGKNRRAVKRTAPYHHGSLREAMLRAAESILERDGIGGLTLRAAAREAGVSHAAPKNHFGDVMGLLSDL